MRLAHSYDGLSLYLYNNHTHPLNSSIGGNSIYCSCISGSSSGIRVISSINGIDISVYLYNDTRQTATQYYTIFKKVW